MPKYFVSAIQPDRQLGAMQFEAPNIEQAQAKAEDMCPETGFFRAWEVDDFDDMPIGEFVDSVKMKELGY